MRVLVRDVRPPVCPFTGINGELSSLIVENGGTIASEGKGSYMWVEGRILDTKGNPIANAQIDTWETDENGLYDTQVSRSQDVC
jgi:protocatechuate 3,4-dioxygenase beta subunit